MNWIRTIFVNILVFSVLISILLLAPPPVYHIYNALVQDPQAQPDSRAKLPNYDQLDWANKHFEEFSKLSASYSDYVTWRRDDYVGETITIENGLRKTVQPQEEANYNTEVWFFGGSTTWGAGVNNEGTYPSIFARETNFHVTNFGETGYLARQSYARLSNEYILNSLKPFRRTIVFYDGVNDVAHGCLTESSELSTMHSQEINTAITNTINIQSPEFKWSYRRTFQQLQDLIVVISDKIFGYPEQQLAKLYNCDTDANKAHLTAKVLVSSWQQAQNLAQANGDDFIAILQPVAFMGNPILDHLYFEDAMSLLLAKQYLAVYPIVKELAKIKGLNVVDLTNVYDGRENLYIDFCHVSPQGHEVLVTELVDIFKSSGNTPVN